MWKVIMAAIGIAVGSAALLMSLGGAGGGHGWIGALWFSVPLVFLYPLVLVRAVPPIGKSSNADAVIVAVAALLDLFLAANMASEQKYVRMQWRFDPTGMSLWLSLWAGWQIVGVTTLLRKRFGRFRSESAR